MRCSGLSLKKKRSSVQLILALEEGNYSLSLYPLAEFGCHTRIHLDGRAALALRKDAHGQIARSRTDFEDHVRRAQIRLVHNPVVIAYVSSAHHDWSSADSDDDELLSDLRKKEEISRVLLGRREERRGGERT